MDIVRTSVTNMRYANLVSALQLISHRRQNKSYLRIQQHNIDKERKGCQNVVHQNKMHVGCGWRLDDVTD